MNRNVTSVKGRLTLVSLVLGSFVLSLLILYIVGRGGAIAGEAARSAIKELLEIYLPLIAMMAAFYFGQHSQEAAQSHTSLEVFVFSVAVVGLWVICPPLFILFGGAIEDIIATINLLKPYGASIAAAGVAFYFAKSGVDEIPPSNA